jgi:hypothetical protein
LDQELKAAIDRFPGRREAIVDFAACNDDFRSICTDLADAEAALRRCRESKAASHATLAQEYRELSEELASEIEAALDAAALALSPRLRQASS